MTLPAELPIPPSAPSDPDIAHLAPLALLDQQALPLFILALHTRRRITFVLSDRGGIGNNYGVTDLDRGVVFLDAANDLGEMRSTIAHELAHLIAPAAQEDEVEQMAAEVLVPLADALDAYARGAIEETAQRLMVDGRLIRARIRAAVLLPPGAEAAS